MILAGFFLLLKYLILVSLFLFGFRCRYFASFSFIVPYHERVCLLLASKQLLVQTYDHSLKNNFYETSMLVPGTQADDNRHAAFHLALNEKYIIR